ncbi:MAG: glycosyltransferase family 9 protein [candidate division KSB1 bacterium]|nr:glycosyltransferase family 9 protein [candidate division KSB1 bacterium]
MPPKIRPNKPRFKFKGTSIFLDKSALKARDIFVLENNITPADTLVFVNPDTSNVYTFIEPDFYISLIQLLVDSGKIDKILLARSYKFEGSSSQIYNMLSPEHQKKTILLEKHAPLSVYASLVDLCDSYVTGDTGPMHIAAARKTLSNSEKPFTNKTSIISLFKATEPKIYGYSSDSNIMISANQDAPSRVFEIKVACKSITCTIQRITKSCNLSECGCAAASLNVIEISKFILDSLKPQTQKVKHEIPNPINWPE